METRKSNWGFRIVIIILLLGIFLELGAILGVLTDGHPQNGDVAVVEVAGPIEDSIPIVRKLKDFSESEMVKAIVVRVNTPGGTVGSSQEIHDEIARIRQSTKKKIVVSMGDVAASGGYYLAVPAEKIFAAPGTLTGSIGVISHYFVVDELLRKFHLKWEIIQSGAYKDIGSPFRELKDEERALLQSMVDDVHDQFVEAVAKGRNMKVEEVRKLADGRILSGRQALKSGLVDELGGLEKAIREAAKMAGVKDKPKIVYPEREKFSWIKRLAQGKIETPGVKVEYRLQP